MNKLFLFLGLTLISAKAISAVSLMSGDIESVTAYEECIVIKLVNQSNAYVYPLANPSANTKLSLAVSALYSGSGVEVAYWPTSTCTSVDSHLEAAPTGNKRYIYSLKVIN